MLKGIVSGNPVDIKRIAMKGKQLYDSAHSTAYAAVLDANNMWVNTSTAKSIKIRVEPSTQYTLSIDSPNNSIFRICESDNADITPQSASSAVELTRIVRGTTIKQYTFTTSDYAQCIIFQGSSSSYEQWNSTLMLNIGSTALPYEPYGYQEGWEVRDQNGAILWGADKTLTANAGSLSYKGYGLPLKDVEVEGNMAQTGTPDPTTPIWPQETGERTGNLWNEDYTGISGNLTYAPVYVGDGSFTLSTSCPAVESAAALFFLAGNVQSGASTASNGVYKNRPITVASIDGYITIAYRYVNTAGGSAYPQNEKTMLNTGSTALPYEPFGYKIPITCAGQTVPVYLEQVSTVRRIKKLVLTGTETGWAASASMDGFTLTVIPANYLRADGAITYLCSHYAAYKQTTSLNSIPDKMFALGSNPNAQRLFFKDSTYGRDLDAFKSYLAQQYAAGTPVTVWYVLATPETAIVNGPIRKIGTYADTLTVTDQDVTITPAVGNDTITVDTALPPSKLTITGHIRERTVT